MVPRHSAPPAGPGRGSLAGLGLLAGAVVLGALSFTALTWYAAGGDRAADSVRLGFGFGDLHADALALGARAASAYFGTLAWTLLTATVLAGVAARAVGDARVSVTLRVVGFVLGAAGLVFTWYAPAQLFAAQRAAGGSAVSVWHDASYGFAFAALAFVLAAVGAVLGPRRTVATTGSATIGR